MESGHCLALPVSDEVIADKSVKTFVSYTLHFKNTWAYFSEKQNCPKLIEFGLKLHAMRQLVNLCEKIDMFNKSFFLYIL